MFTIILAGGKSSRMGQNKALMKVGGSRVIDRITDELKPVSRKILVIANDVSLYQHLDAIILEDEPVFRGQGPLAGIYTGLRKAAKGPCLVVACDMPFASAKLGSEVISILTKHEKDAVVPIQNNRMHPLFAAYDAGIAEIVKKTLERGQRSVKALLDQIDVEFINIDEELKAVWNMNTPDEYIQAVKMAEGRDEHDV